MEQCISVKHIILYSYRTTIVFVIFIGLKVNSFSNVALLQDKLKFCDHENTMKSEKKP